MQLSEAKEILKNNNFICERAISGVKINNFNVDRLSKFDTWPILAVERIASSISDYVVKGSFEIDPEHTKSPNWIKMKAATEGGYSIKLLIKEAEFKGKKQLAPSDIALTISYPDGEELEWEWEDIDPWGQKPDWLLAFNVIKKEIPELKKCKVNW